MELIERDITANGIKLHIYHTTTGRPPLVFAHGITDNGLCFTPIAEKLAGDFEILLYDARGHGKSDAGAGSSSILDRAKDLAGLVDALHLHKPNLLGHSMGALTVALCAGLYPDLPGRIILEDPPTFEMMADRSRGSLEGRKAWRDMAAANKGKTIPELVEMNRRESPAWSEAEREPWALSKQQFSLAVFDETYLDLGTAKQIIAKITCPVLILTADSERGGLYPPQAADELADRLPGGRHVHIPGAGHNIRREQPTVYLQAVRDFLQGTS